MVQTRDPALSTQSDLWKSLDWLLEEPADPATGRGTVFERVAHSRAGRFLQRLGAVGSAGLVAGLVLLTGVVAWALWPAPQARAIPQPASPAPPRIEAPFAPGAMRTLSRDAAIALNAATVAGDVPVPSAASFVLKSPEPTDYQRSLDCLTQAIHYEAGSEGVDGGRAVAQVILNRVRHPAYPDTVCGVIYEGAKRATGCQFTFACDGSLARIPSPRAWQRARAIAVSALAGDVYETVGWSTHYHANYVVPYWAASLRKTATVGAHIFYRWTGNWGESGAFNRRYAGAEPLAALLLGAEAGLAAAQEDAEAVQDADTPALPEARPILLSAQPGATKSDATRDPQVREVALGDRQVLIHPKAAASEVSAEAGTVDKTP
ncbi:cell wall hydrolase [Sphingomonas sp. R647]|uniref:cell wall hydrolase n=1 Tax=Sphingomonas sp. R647 TaxID=2875233 RepID=UPI001CD6BF39|nr:cell wall hydrolase [Sphingomonas sp. R647]MCA1196365.1 cell wall hydrolase [Sphingomonas sp. R647]